MSVQKQKKKSMWTSFIHWLDINVLPWTYIRALGVAIFLALITAIAGYMYYGHITEKNQVAQQIFAECVEEYQKVCNQGQSKSWDHVRTLTQLGYEQNQNSEYAPYFLVLLANIAQEQQDTNQAIQLMQQAIEKISSRISLYNLYRTKLALMKMDSVDQKIQGLEELNQIAQDPNNKQQDIALYYLGLYYWTESNLNKAQEYWNKLKSFAAGEQPSPWALKADQLMQQVMMV